MTIAVITFFWTVLAIAYLLILSRRRRARRAGVCSECGSEFYDTPKRVPMTNKELKKFDELVRRNHPWPPVTF
jgi:hypothetical protein